MSKLDLQTKDGKNYTIRRARGEDAGKIVDCINSVGAEKIHIVIEKFSHNAEWEKNYIESLDLDNVLYLVVEMKGAIVGMLSLEREKYNKLMHTATLGMILMKGYRQSGIGSALLETSIEWAKLKKIKKICLSCFSTNRAAITLYKKFGFEEEGRRKNQFKIDGKYADEVIMALWV
ncbi:MAG: GNAT family N-acetyltransferase [Thermoplasmata archaeon]|nr:MAG: GNAT family N-acetyltransferase [Thermoplasmata archaeon]